MRKLLLILISFILCGLQAQAQQPRAEEILAKVISVYAGCHSYSDQGITRLQLEKFPAREATFQTTFVRPGLRFEISYNRPRPAKNDLWVVWTDGQTDGSWNSHQVEAARAPLVSGA